MPGKCLRKCPGGVWEVYKECLGGAWRVSRKCLGSDCGMFGKCLRSAWEVSEGYRNTGEESEEVSGRCLGGVCFGGVCFGDVFCLRTYLRGYQECEVSTRNPDIQAISIVRLVVCSGDVFL